MVIGAVGGVAAGRHAALRQPRAVGHRLGLHLVLPRHPGLRADHPLGQPRGALSAALRRPAVHRRRVRLDGQRPAGERTSSCRRSSPSASTRRPTPPSWCAPASSPSRRARARRRSSLGMSPPLTMRRIVLPQAMRVIIPTIGNETISMLKTTSLIAVIGGHRAVRPPAAASTRRPSRSSRCSIVACAWYLFLTSILTIGQHYLEALLRQGLRREGDRGGGEARRPQGRAQHATSVDDRRPRHG